MLCGFLEKALKEQETMLDKTQGEEGGGMIIINQDILQEEKVCKRNVTKKSDWYL